MIALLTFATAAALLFLAARFVAPISRGGALVLLLLPLLFTGRAVFIGGVYAPVELPYDTPPLSEHRQELRVGPDQNPMLTDIAFILIPWREAVRRAVGEGEWPLLNRFELCGEPLAAAMQPAVYSPFTWIALILPAAVSFTYTASMAFFLAGLGAFLFARELGRSEMAALIAAAIFMFSAPIALQILWPLGFAWALLPLLLLAMRRAVLTHNVALLTIVFTLVIVAGHPETLLHSVTIASIYGLFLLRHWRGAAAVVVAGALALLLTAVALLPFFEAAPYAGEHRVRSQMYAPAPLKVAPGTVKASLLGDLFPFLRTHFTSLPLPRGEAGSLALALAIVAVVRVRSRETWFFAGLLVFALLVGSNAWPVAQLLHRLPLFSVAINDRMVSAVPLCLAILAAFAIDLRSAGIPSVSEGPGGAGGAPPDHPGPSLTLGMTTVVALIVLIGGAALWFGAPMDRVRLAAELLPLAAVIFVRRPQFVLALILAQRVVADGALVPTHRAEVAYPPLALFKPLANVREPFRIVAPGGTLVPDIATMYGLEDVRGATAMTFEPLAYQTFPIWPAADLTRPMLSMMNARYAVIGAADVIPSGWHEVTVDHQSRLIENERVLPRAFVPRNVRGAASALEEMKGETDFGERAWIEGVGEGANGPGRVDVMRDGSQLRMNADMHAAGYVVISQAAWPGWRAYVDGRRVRTVRANHAFLAVYVPAGHHQIRLRYLPQSFVVGRTISIAVAALLLLALLIRQVV
jgi:hypothetical protein